MTIKERIQEYIDSKNINTNAFEKAIGASKSYWRNTKNISAEMLGEISRVYSDLSIDWILTGNGNMIKEDVDIKVIHKPKATEKKLEAQEVNLYDIDAAANLKTLLDQKNQNILGSIKIPNLPKCDGAVYVKGDSMYPLLKSGDIVMYKEVNDIDNIIYGEMYLISMDLGGDDYLSVKYINKSDISDHVKLVSYNKHHEPKDIPFKSIRAIALVKASVRMNTMN